MPMAAERRLMRKQLRSDRIPCRQCDADLREGDADADEQQQRRELVPLGYRHRGREAIAQRRAVQQTRDQDRRAPRGHEPGEQLRQSIRRERVEQHDRHDRRQHAAPRGGEDDSQDRHGNRRCADGLPGDRPGPSGQEQQQRQADGQEVARTVGVVQRVVEPFVGAREERQHLIVREGARIQP